MWVSKKEITAVYEEMRKLKWDLENNNNRIQRVINGIAQIKQDICGEPEKQIWNPLRVTPSNGALYPQGVKTGTIPAIPGELSKLKNMIDVLEKRIEELARATGFRWVSKMPGYEKIQFPEIMFSTKTKRAK